MKKLKSINIDSEILKALPSKIPIRQESAYTEFLYKCLLDGKIQIEKTQTGLKLVIGLATDTAIQQRESPPATVAS